MKLPLPHASCSALSQLGDWNHKRSFLEIRSIRLVRGKSPTPARTILSVVEIM